MKDSYEIIIRMVVDKKGVKKKDRKKAERAKVKAIILVYSATVGHEGVVRL